MFPNQRTMNNVPGAKNSQTSPSKVKAKGKARPKRPPTGLAGVQLYGNAGGRPSGSMPGGASGMGGNGPGGMGC